MLLIVHSFPQVFDELITRKWAAQVMATPGQDVTWGMVNWCIAELQWKANIFRQTGAVSVYTADVVKSDTAVPERLKNGLKKAVKLLEDIPEAYKDWHPGSDRKVLNLVHPSLFPLVYGRTRILPNSLTTLGDCVTRCGEGVVAPIPPEEEAQIKQWRLYQVLNLYSRKFQWLPCEVDISGKSKRVKYVPLLYRSLY